MFGKIRPGKYAVYISSRDAMVSNDAAPVFFYIFPESRITLFQTAMTPPAFSSPPSPSPTQSSPISALLPVVVFVIMLVLRFVLKER
jgi:hypothetical protein